MLDGKKRGDRITALEIVESTGFENWRSFSNVIHAWARANKLALFPVRHDGWRIGLPAEHADAAESKRKAARRREMHGLDLLVYAPRAEMTEAQNRRTEFLASRAAQRVQRAETDHKDIRHELKLEGRVPLRLKDH
jgi:hypothetical protein